MHGHTHQRVYTHINICINNVVFLQLIYLYRWYVVYLWIVDRNGRLPKVKYSAIAPIYSYACTRIYGRNPTYYNTIWYTHICIISVYCLLSRYSICCYRFCWQNNVLVFLFLFFFFHFGHWIVKSHRLTLLSDIN